MFTVFYPLTTVVFCIQKFHNANARRTLYRMITTQNVTTLRTLRFPNTGFSCANGMQSLNLTQCLRKHVEIVLRETTILFFQSNIIYLSYGIAGHDFVRQTKGLKRVDMQCNRSLPTTSQRPLWVVSGLSKVA